MPSKHFWASRVLLPEWSAEIAAALAAANIEIFREPTRIDDGRFDATLELDASSDRDARVRIAAALQDFFAVWPGDHLVTASFSI